jgi:hypothetical protein
LSTGWEGINPFDLVHMPIIMSVIMMPMMGADMVRAIMEAPELNEFLAGDEQFDVCILEIFTSEALLGIAEKYNCVLLEYTTFDAYPWIDRISGKYVGLFPFRHPTSLLIFLPSQRVTRLLRSSSIPDVH